MVMEEKRWLLVLLSTLVSCLAERFRPFKKYEYLYESQSFNALNHQTNGPKSSCKVELSSPGSCQFVLRTSDCKLSEVMMKASGDDQEASGEASRAQEEFSRAMERNPLKFTTEGEDVVHLFPEQGERTNILNFKRGIISALAVPLIQDDRKRRTPSIFGACETEYRVNSGEGLVLLRRDLSSCDGFKAIQDHRSPFSLFTGLDQTLAQLIQSNQTCHYSFDREQQHLTSGACSETHLLLPFSNRGHGAKNSGKQVLTLVGVFDEERRDFEHDASRMKPLRMDRSINKSPVQDPVEALALLRELLAHSKSKLPRSHLAFKLVSVLRRLERETLSALVPQALALSQPLTYQFLLQCGSPECTGALVRSVGALQEPEGVAEALLYAVAMASASSSELVREMLEVARVKPSRAVFYALSYTVRRHHEREGAGEEVQNVARFFLQEIGNCSGDQEHLRLSLRVMGNMGSALFSALPALDSAVSKCINHPSASPAAQQAAIHVYRQSPPSKEVRSVLLEVLFQGSASVQKKVAAYLILMRDPASAELSLISDALQVEPNPQVQSFIVSHLISVLRSRSSETQDLMQKIVEAFQKNMIERLAHTSPQLSRYYCLGSLEGNFLFESERSLLPRELMLEMSLEAFGVQQDLLELHVEGDGFEPIVEAFFGEDGFFPDTVMKSILFASERLPEELNEILDNMLPNMNMFRRKRQAPENIVQEIRHNLHKLLEELKNQNAPEATMFLKLFGVELGYLDLKDGRMIGRLLQMIPADQFVRRLLSGLDHEFFLHYVFLDSEFYLPTGAGFPLRGSLAGTIAPGVRGGLKLSPEKVDFSLLLSTGVELRAEFGAHFPDYVHSGLGIYTNIHLKSSVRGSFSGSRQHLRLSLLPPQETAEIFSITNIRTSFTGEKVEVVPSSGLDLVWKPCTLAFAGVELCQTLQYPVSSSDGAHFPLSGDFSYRLALVPSGSVSEYSADLRFSQEAEEEKLELRVRAEGSLLEARSSAVLNQAQGTLFLSALIQAFPLEYRASAVFRWLTLELESELLLPGTTSAQSLVLKHDFSPETKREWFEAELKSRFSSEVRLINPLLRPMELLINNILEQRMGPNKIQLRDVLEKLAKFGGVPGLTSISVPEKLFLNLDLAGKYDAGMMDYTITLPLPLGGHSLQALNLPSEISTPNLILPELGLRFESTTIALPALVIPEEVLLEVPIFDSVAVSGKLSSNFYDLEASASALRDPEVESRYSAKVEVTGTGPVELLSLKLEGSGQVESTPDDAQKANMKVELQHKLFEAIFRVDQEVQSAGKLIVHARNIFEVTSHYADLRLSLEDTRTIEVNDKKMSAEGNLEGSFEAWPISGSGSFQRSIVLIPSQSEAKIETTLKINSNLLQAQNSIAASFINGELQILSSTGAFGDRLTHIAKISLQELEFELNLETKAHAGGVTFLSTAQTRSTTDEVKVKIETSAAISQERFHSLLSGALDENGLAAESEASVKLMGHTASHKATLRFDQSGLTSSGFTSLKSLLSGKEVKSSFEIAYSNFSGSAKVISSGEMLGGHGDHSTRLEMNRLAITIRNQLYMKNSVFQVNHRSHASTVPFNVQLNTTLNGKDTMYLYGNRYGASFMAKFRLRADSESFVHMQECSFSTRSEMTYYKELELTFQSTSNSTLTLSEQKSSFMVNAKIDDVSIQHELLAYNDLARAGLELSAGFHSNQENKVSALLKYDKSQKWYSVDLPFVESFRLALLNLRVTYPSVVGPLRVYLNREGIYSRIQEFQNVLSKLNFERPSEEVQIGADQKTLYFFKGKVRSTVEAHLRSLMFYIVEELTLLFTRIETQSYSMIDLTFKEESTPLSPPQMLPLFTSLPVFGKLFGEIKLSSIFVNLETSVELKGLSEDHPAFAVLLKTDAASMFFEPLNFNLESTAQVSLPESTPLEVNETLKITHALLVLEQQGSLTLNSEVSRHAAGSSLSLQSLYKNQLSIPLQELSSKFSLTQRAIVVHEKSAGFSLSVKNEGRGMMAVGDFSDEGTHTSELCLNMGLSNSKLSFNGDIDSETVAMKMNISTDAAALSHLRFNVFSEINTPVLKSSKVVAFGKVSFNDFDVDINGSYKMEFRGPVDGLISSQLSIKNSPLSIEFLNLAKARSDLFETVLADVHLQYDYVAVLDWDRQEVSAGARAELNQFFYSHNFTAVNNKTELGVYARVQNRGSLGLLSAIELLLPPLIYEISEAPSFIHRIGTDEEPLSLNSRLVYEKSWFDPQSGLFWVPSFGKLVSDLTYSSSILSLTTKAGISPSDYQIHFSATSSSAFENLNGKLSASSSLIAGPLLEVSSHATLECPNLEGKHSSSLTFEENYETVLTTDTVATLNLTINDRKCTIEAIHQLSGDTKILPKATSNLKLNYTFLEPDSEASGYGSAENTLKFNTSLSSFFIESISQVTTNTSVTGRRGYDLIGTIDNEAKLSLSSDGLKSLVKMTGDGIYVWKYSVGNELILFDINEELMTHATLERIYVLLQIHSNYSVSYSKDKRAVTHKAFGKADLVPLSTALAALEFFLTQPGRSEFDNRSKWYAHSNDTHTFNVQVFSRWFNISTDLTAVNTGDYRDKHSFWLSYNFTSPSMLAEYDGKLLIDTVQ